MNPIRVGDVCYSLFIDQPFMLHYQGTALKHIEDGPPQITTKVFRPT